MKKTSRWIVGNWKMHGSKASVDALARAVAAAEIEDGVEAVLCPPAIWLGAVHTACAGSAVQVGGQDCHSQAEGAFTGNVSAAMLKDIGCKYVIVGHSERRQYERETSADVKRKAEATIENGLVPIICVGELLEDRESGDAEAVVGRQLAESVPQGEFLLAYEPVWAIGSGKVPSIADIEAMHSHIIKVSGGAPVLYGGSVKATNSAEILAVAGVSGVLVGGASLKAEEFKGILTAAAGTK